MRLNNFLMIIEVQFFIFIFKIIILVHPLYFLLIYLTTNHYLE